MCYLVNKRKVHLEAVSDERGSFCATGIRRDDDGLSEIGDVLLDVVLDQWLAVEVIDGDIKKALVLWVVEIHGDDVVGASAGEKVGDEIACLGNPLLVAGFGLESSHAAGLLVIMGGEAALRGEGAVCLVAAAIVGGGIGGPGRKGFGTVAVGVVASVRRPVLVDGRLCQPLG